MSDKDMGKALLRSEDPIDVDALTRGVLRRDRRRMWFLGIACVIAWMLVVMLPWATIMPVLAKVIEHQAETSSGAYRTIEQREQPILLLQIVKEGTIATFIGSIASMLVAALCTVSLVILSRRATLRQVNARLGEISAQVKSMIGQTK